ncbi:hypothetical protein IF650_02440 [Cellulosimicrobium terreum]|nr:hypothetical protein [Cellulosimicrobium terreum]
MLLTARVPHDLLVDALRGSGHDLGRIGPTDERGWTFADVAVPSATTGPASPPRLADVVARVDVLVPGAPWVAVLDPFEQETDEAGTALVVFRDDRATAPVVARWSVLEDEQLRCLDDPATVVDAAARLTGQAIPRGTAVAALRDVTQFERLGPTLNHVLGLPTTERPEGGSVAYLVRADPTLVRAAVRAHGSGWLRVLDARTSLLVTSLSGTEVLDAGGDVAPGYPEAVLADLDVLQAVERRLGAGDAVVRLDRSGDHAWSWALSTRTAGRTGTSQRFGNWDPDWTFLDDAQGRSGAVEAFESAFGASLEPTTMRALLDARSWPHDPVAELARQLRVPPAVADALADPDRFRHGTEHLAPVSSTAPLTEQERTALRVGAPGGGLRAVRDLLLVGLGVLAAVAGVVLLATGGTVVGADATPWYSGPLLVVGLLLSISGLAARSERRSARRRYLGKAA